MALRRDVKRELTLSKVVERERERNDSEKLLTVSNVKREIEMILRRDAKRELRLSKNVMRELTLSKAVI